MLLHGDEEDEIECEDVDEECEDVDEESDEDRPGHSHAISFVHDDEEEEGEDDQRIMVTDNHSAKESKDSGKS